MLERLKRHPLKTFIGIITLCLFGFVGFDAFTGCCLPHGTMITYYARVITLASAALVIAMYTRKSIEGLLDGPINSAKALVLGIWITYMGAFLHLLIEDIPEAIIARLHSEYGIMDHDHPLHWLIHWTHDIQAGNWNLVGIYLFGLGSFLILISSQNLSQSKVWQVVIWILLIVFFWFLLYNYMVLPLLGLA